MDRVTGQTLYNNNISMDEAVKGQGVETAWGHSSRFAGAAPITGATPHNYAAEVEGVGLPEQSFATRVPIFHTQSRGFASTYLISGRL